MKKLMALTVLVATSPAFAGDYGSSSVASAASTASSSKVGGSQLGKFSVRNSAGATNMSGAAMTRSYDNGTRMSVAETWSNGQDYSRTNNMGGVGSASSAQAGSASAAMSQTYNTWSW